MFKRTAISAAVVTTLLTAVSANAQDTQRIEITGSAIKRLDAETSVPVTIIRADDIKKQGVTSVEQVMSLLSSAQMQQRTSQVVGAGTGGSSFANLRGIGENKTLVLLNGRRIANNALDSSAPDLNMIPFAVIDRIEVLRDGASALYGTDAIGGVINFITKTNYVGGSATVGFDAPKQDGGDRRNANLGFGWGDLAEQKFNIFGFVDLQKEKRIAGNERNYNKRIPGGISPSPFPGNYYQGGDNGNPLAPDCAAPNLISDGATGCNIATAAFVNYTPQTERVSGMLKGTFQISNDHTVGVEYFASRSKIESVIAPVPYGGLYQNRVRADGSLNPFYPGNPGSSVTSPNISLDPNYTEPSPNNPAGSAGPRAGLLPGFVHVRWRDLVNGSRQDISTNRQQRFIASLDGIVGGWDYQTALTFNENRYKQELAGYSDGGVITSGVLNGIINPFGDQSAEGLALIQSAALGGELQTAKGTVTSVDAKASRELGDWLGAGRAVAIAVGGEVRHEKFTNRANTEFAQRVIASTGFDPNTLNDGKRTVQAAFVELNVPVIKSFDITAAVRYDNYSDFGSATNPKVGFRFQPNDKVLVRGSASKGFRAPSLYEINAAPYYTNTSNFDDPVNCPGGTPVPGKSRAANCNQQFQALFGGNKDLQPEKSKNYTLGLAFAPTANLSLGIDFWWIRIKNTIDSLEDTTVFDDPQTYSGVFNRNPQGNLSTDGSQCPDPLTCGYLDLRTQNLGGVKTNGIDLSASYRVKGGGLGDYLFSAQSTYVNKYEYQNTATGPWLNRVGVFSGLGPVFRWQHNLSASWSLGGFGLGLTAHFKSGYKDQDPENEVASYTTFDLFGTWAPSKALVLTAGLKNLFDREPPFSNQTKVFQAGYDPRYSDPTGRALYLRGTLSF